MPAAHIPATMRAETAGRSTIRIAGATVAEAFETITDKCPGLRAKLLNDTGRLHGFVAVFVNSQDIRTLDGLDPRVRDDDEIHIIGAIAGG